MAYGKGRIGNVAAFFVHDAQRLGRRPSGVRKLNPYLIDRSGMPLHVWRHDPTSAGEAQ
jgi:hypothetical protein